MSTILADQATQDASTLDAAATLTQLSQCYPPLNPQTSAKSKEGKGGLTYQRLLSRFNKVLENVAIMYPEDKDQARCEAIEELINEALKKVGDNMKSLRNDKPANIKAELEANIKAMHAQFDGSNSSNIEEGQEEEEDQEQEEEDAIDTVALAEKIEERIMRRRNEFLQMNDKRSKLAKMALPVFNAAMEEACMAKTVEEGQRIMNEIEMHLKQHKKELKEDIKRVNAPSANDPVISRPLHAQGKKQKQKQLVVSPPHPPFSPLDYTNQLQAPATTTSARTALGKRKRNNSDDATANGEIRIHKKFRDIDFGKIKVDRNMDVDVIFYLGLVHGSNAVADNIGVAVQPVTKQVAAAAQLDAREKLNLTVDQNGKVVVMVPELPEMAPEESDEDEDDDEDEDQDEDADDEQSAEGSLKVTE